MIAFLLRFSRILVVAAGIGFGVLPQLVGAVTISAPIRLSNLSGYSRSPQIAAYNNNLYVVWAEGIAASQYDIFLRRSINNGDSWQPVVKVAAGVTTPTPSPQVAGGNQGIYVFWTDNFTKNSQGSGIFFSRSIDGGNTFSQPVVAIAKGNTGYTRPSSVLVDATGASDHIFFAWYDSRYAGGDEIGQAMLTVSCDSGATFSTAQHVSANDRGNDAESPRLALASDGTLYILYRSSLDAIPQQGSSAPFSQRLIRSSSISCGANPPVTWSQPSQVVSHHPPEELGTTFGSHIATGAGGRLHIAYWSEANGNNLIHRAGYPLTTGWNNPVDLTSPIPGYGPNHLIYDGSGAEYGLFGLGEDTGGNVHAAMWQAGTTVIDGFKLGKLYYLKGTVTGQEYTYGSVQAIENSEITFDSAAVLNNNRLATVWGDFRDRDSGAGGSEIYYRHVYTQTITGKQVSVGTNSLDFGSQLINSTGTPLVVSISIIGDQPVTFSGVSTSGPFSAATDCSVQTSGSTCTVSVAFSPTNSIGPSGVLTIYSDAQNTPHTVLLSGTVGTSLVDHYYYSILDRAPDAVGRAFWDSEVVRLASLGVDPKEAFIVMANYFFTSAEYLGKNTSDVMFLSNLYRTFFARNPDTTGQTYWLGRLQVGMPRDIVMFNFLFSSEFNSFSSAFLGSNSSRAEVLAVVDYYRGILGRLPDSSGLPYWVGRFRNAQCLGSGAVYAEASSISASFFTSAEYLGKNRTNSQYVSDLYNAFLRRGGDIVGFNFWVNELSTGNRTRDGMRSDFISTPEFGSRVAAIVTQGCYQ